jgi:hypothetical protein
MPSSANELTYQPLRGVLTEDEVIHFLNINQSLLSALRYRGLPFIKLNAKTRLYLEDDLISFFIRGRVTLNAETVES